MCCLCITPHYVLIHRGFDDGYSALLNVFVCICVYDRSEYEEARMTSKELRKLLMQAGCRKIREGKGSHEIWQSPITGIKFVVPHPKKSLPIGTVRSIRKAAGI